MILFQYFTHEICCELLSYKGEYEDEYLGEEGDMEDEGDYYDGEENAMNEQEYYKHEPPPMDYLQSALKGEHSYQTH